MSAMSPFETEVASQMLDAIKAYVDEFRNLVEDPDKTIERIPKEELFELFSEAFRVKAMWDSEDDPQARLVRDLLSTVVDFLCVEIVRRHKEGIL